jgi:hypothetical protein
MTPRSPASDEADRKARFCLAYGIAPSEYDDLTDIEIAAFKRAARELVEENRNG